MSLLNLTGEDADPVKALVFRELRDASVRRKEEEKVLNKEEEIRAMEERKERNRRWREKREKKESSTLDINWEEESDQESRDQRRKKHKSCICL